MNKTTIIETEQISDIIPIKVNIIYVILSGESNNLN